MEAMMAARIHVVAAALALVLAGCAAPSTTPVAADHPANPSAAEAPPPRPSQALGVSTTLAARPFAASVYTCPHHPEVVSNEPGVCPKCGMQLQPKGADQTPSAPTAQPHEHGDPSHHGGQP
jgi:hypothetical protein